MAIRKKLPFDQLSGVNYDIPSTKTGFSAFSSLVG
jgi:hypothetical protein